MNSYLVLDIGGTYLKYAHMTEEAILNRGNIKTVKESFDAFITQLKSIYDSYKKEVEGVAISMPGVIHPEEGYVFHGGGLWFIENMPLKDILEKEFKTKVSIENDGKSAALGEAWKGQLANVNNGVVLVIGTGVGGGIIANGQLVRGEYFSAGEFSSIRTNGLDRFNISETLGEKVNVNNLTNKVAQTIQIDSTDFNGKDLLKLIEQNDRQAKEIFDKYCDFIIGQIINLQMILDPECFVISGGISANPLLIQTLNKSLENFYAMDCLSERAGRNTKLLKSKLGNDANLWGALYHYLTIHNKNK